MNWVMLQCNEIKFLSIVVNLTETVGSFVKDSVIQSQR